MSEPIILEVALTDAQIEQIAQRAAELVSQRDASPYLDTPEAASYLRCSRGRIFDLVQLQKLSPVRDGRRLLFKRSDLEAYLERASEHAGR